LAYPAILIAFAVTISNTNLATLAFPVNNRTINDGRLLKKIK